MNDNAKILQLLRDYLEKYPQQRFGQALVNLDVLILSWNDAKGEMNVSDPYYETDDKILERMKKAYSEMTKSDWVETDE